MIARDSHIADLLRALREFPVVALLGARQVGKTTLASAVADRWKGPSTRFDLEDPRTLERLRDPAFVLGELRGMVILDEVQRRPDLFPVLRVLADRPRRPARFLLLGSASPDLLRQGSETLAGRIHWHELSGLVLDEVGPDRLSDLWIRGGFPRSLLARSGAASWRWRNAFVRTYLERDLPALGLALSPAAARRFWTMLAHWHGQRWNASEFSRAFGVTDKTVNGYLDLLCGAFLARRVAPWHENVAKRQVKAPRIYLTDSGILHSLLGLRTREEVLSHPRSGASWEGFAMEQVVATLGARPEECFHWGLHTGAEMDLVVMRGSRRRGFEMKLTSSPRVTPSIRSAMETLALERVDVIHAGEDSYPLSRGVRAVALANVTKELSRLR